MATVASTNHYQNINQYFCEKPNPEAKYCGNPFFVDVEQSAVNSKLSARFTTVIDELGLEKNKRLMQHALWQQSFTKDGQLRYVESLTANNGLQNTEKKQASDLFTLGKTSFVEQGKSSFFGHQPQNVLAKQKSSVRAKGAGAENAGNESPQSTPKAMSPSPFGRYGSE